MKMIPTHTLNGVPVAERTDTLKRPFYINIETKKRVSHIGKVVTPLLAVEETETHDLTHDIARFVGEGGPDLDDRDPFGEIWDDPTVEDSALAELPLGDIPTEIAFDDFAVAVEAQRRMYSERGNVSARYIGDNTVILSLPSIMGGSERFRLTFPETIPVVMTRTAE